MMRSVSETLQAPDADTNPLAYKGFILLAAMISSRGV